MLIYVIRHGQTDWNVSERFQGSRDIPLNGTGRAQARANGRLLATLTGPEPERFDYVASPLGRTRETMEILRAEMGLRPSDYRTDDRLIEVSFGDWESFTLRELAQTEPERVARREQGKWDFLPPGASAESYEILSWRVAAWLRSVARDTVCVAHGGVIRALFHLVGRVPGEQAASLATPQDRILRLADGRIEWVSGEGVFADVSSDARGY